MLNNELKKAIRELADDLSFLPEEKISEVITYVIEDLLPLAILAMKDDSVTIDSSRLKAVEFQERRRWGKDMREFEEKIYERREILKHLQAAKSMSIDPKEIDLGSQVMIMPQRALTNIPITKQSSTNSELEHLSEESLSSLVDFGMRHSRGGNLHFTIDHSLNDRMKDAIFVKFCSTIEKSSRRIAMAHKNQFNFILKERKDVELPDWNRTVLFVQFPKVKFEDGNILWSILSNETRNDMKNVIKILGTEDLSHFTDYVEKFNVEMDF